MERDQSEPIIQDELYRLALLTLKNVNNEIAASFQTSFPDVELLPKKNLKASLLPITSSVPSVGSTSASTNDLVEAIKKCYFYQSWRQPYAIEDFGNKFFDNSAWFPIADVNGPIVYSNGLMEMMLMGSGLTYPKHKHNPEELYIVLAGKVWWEAENARSSPAWKHAGDVIHHAPNQTHSVTGGDEPVLILNLWRGGSFEMPEIV
jgi:hypothetical protein